MGVGNKMSNITDGQVLAIAMIAFALTFIIGAWREDRRNRLWDEAWRAGYEQGMKVVKHNVR
jgi:hypothetical protein